MFVLNWPAAWTAVLYELRRFAISPVCQVAEHFKLDSEVWAICEVYPFLVMIDFRKNQLGCGLGQFLDYAFDREGLSASSRALPAMLAS